MAVKKGSGRTPAARTPARAGRQRQRQRLIDACISALHLHGPSRTTVGRVVAIAKMSPGIVRFYFDSKAAMLVASLQFLSTEFEELVLVPVAALKDTPVAALRRMVELYLDPGIASARKVSVWYSFWGEASSRQEYYDICGQKDERFAQLVRLLVARLVQDTGARHLDPDAIALGLIGVLEILWQDFAFQTEAAIDREAARRRAMAYLQSTFPGQFAAAGSAKAAPASARAAPAEAAPPAPELAALAARIRSPGDFLTVESAAERILMLRDAAGQVRTWRLGRGR
jgi:TetR/AcrR family transcriptional repressor of bet genes